MLRSKPPEPSGGPFVSSHVAFRPVKKSRRACSWAGMSIGRAPAARLTAFITRSNDDGSDFRFHSVAGFACPILVRGRSASKRSSSLCDPFFLSRKLKPASLTNASDLRQGRPGLEGVLAAHQNRAQLRIMPQEHAGHVIIGNPVHSELRIEARAVIRREKAVALQPA